MLDRTKAPVNEPIENIALSAPEKVVLDNGVNLYHINSENLEVTKLELVFHAGTWFEKKPGVSFFTIKSLNDGTRKRSSSEITNLIDSYGTFLDLEHGLDFSSLSVYFPHKYSNEILALINEVFFEPNFPEDELELRKKRKVQSLRIEEKKNNILANKAFRELLFPSNHPYGRRLTESKINEIQREYLENFHKSFINGFFTIYLSGKTDESILKLINQYFGQVPLSKPNNQAFYPLDESEQTLKVINKPGSVQSSVRTGCLGISKKHTDYFKLYITNVILGGYFGSRLIQNIRENKGLTYGIYSQLVNLVFNDYLLISTETKSDLRASCLEEIQYEIIQMQENPVLHEELQTVKNYLLGSILNNFSNPFQVINQYKSLHQFGLADNYFEKFIEAVKNFSAEDCLYASQTYYQLDDFKTVIVE